MKLARKIFVLWMVAVLVVPALALAEAEDTPTAKVKSFFGRVDAWRLKEYEHFKELKEKNEQDIHEQDLAKDADLKKLDELDPDSLPHTNYISKGDNVFLKRPMTLARIYFFSFLIFIFSSAFIFYLSLAIVIFLIFRYFWLHFF